MMQIHQIMSSTESLDEVEALLEQNHLPTQDVSEGNIIFFRAEENDRLAGIVGVEVFGSRALLRSLAVSDRFKGKGVGNLLVRHVLSYCSNEWIDEVYLLTTTAERYFPRFGFVQIERNIVPDAIRKSREFSDICPSSSTVMRLLV